MSCYMIYYVEGAKRMRPVHTAAEYRDLRDSKRQQLLVASIRQGEVKQKQRLLQMNYSCLPGSDRRLKGAKMPSMSVGMDVDFDPSDPDYERKMAAVPQLVLAKREALGLLMLERSARKGYHVVFRRRFTEGLAEGRVLENQVRNLRWASELLGVRYDEGAKDITRVFFTTTASAEDLLFLDEALFDTEQGACPTGGDVTGGTVETRHWHVSTDGSTPVSGMRQTETTPEATPEATANVLTVKVPQVAKAAVSEATPTAAKSYQGWPFEAIISKYFELFNGGKLPMEGDRNVKTFELAMTLRPICDYDQGRLEAVIPRYDGFEEEEWRRTIESALKEPRKGMPYRLRQVLNALRQEAKLAVTGGTRETPPPMPQRLPGCLALLTSKVPDLYKPAVSEAVFPALGAHLHGVRFRYWDNVDHEATFMHVLIAPMSVGKGCIKRPIDYLLADIREADKPNRQREAEWKRKNPSGKTKAKDPRPADLCIQLLIDNLTDAVFNQRVVDADANGQRFIYTRVDEVEQLKKVTSRGTIDEVSILIRKAFDNAEHGQERVGADSVTGNAPLRWNFNASTTIPNARRFFARAVNDGTLSRLNLSTIIKPLTEGETDEGDPAEELPVYGLYDEAFAEAIQPYVDRLSAANGLIECPEALQLAKELTLENDRRATLCESEAYRVLSYRANVIAYLKAMVLYVAEGYQWSEAIADYVRWSEQMDLWCKMRFFGSQLEEELQAEQQQLTASPQNLLALLPEEFTYEQFFRLRQQQGRTSDGKSTLRVWKSRGYIAYDEVSGAYRKLRN